MSHLAVNAEKCNQDGICIKACPAAVIELSSEDNLPVAVKDFEDYCLACGHCVAVCPTGAFSMEWLKTGECPSISKELVLSPDQAEQFLRSRRSIRNFKDKPVERQKLVIKKYPQQAEERGLPRLVEAWDGGQERICRGAPHVVVVHGDKDYALGAQDSATALSYLELYAPTLGLGTCWGGYFFSAVNAYPPLFEALGIPADHKAFGAVMVGYPQLRYQRLPLRKEPRITWIP
jgi:NAD-dependent dihydropyrimidine dehydrogenase PreA subunit